jgi:RimJ/RimL family protein N-acetyltransferase
LLRPFAASDAPAVQLLAGEREIAANTLSIPHPYLPGMAESWIATHETMRAEGKKVSFAITLAQERTLIGAIGLEIAAEHRRAELGYWIGKPYWGRGYATEAARAVVDYGFKSLGLQRIHAGHFSRNPASGRVLAKIGMRKEGTLRSHIEKWGTFVDVEFYGILRSDLDERCSRSADQQTFPQHSPIP